jgi:hypothetical protein
MESFVLPTGFFQFMIRRVNCEGTPVLLRWPITLEVVAGGMAVEVEPSLQWRYCAPVICCSFRGNK